MENTITIKPNAKKDFAIVEIQRPAIYPPKERLTIGQIKARIAQREKQIVTLQTMNEDDKSLLETVNEKLEILTTPVIKVK
jgi:hypothetical protein